MRKVKLFLILYASVIMVGVGVVASWAINYNPKSVELIKSWEIVNNKSLDKTLKGYKFVSYEGASWNSIETEDYTRVSLSLPATEELVFGNTNKDDRYAATLVALHNYDYADVAMNALSAYQKAGGDTKTFHPRFFKLMNPELRIYFVVGPYGIDIVDATISGVMASEGADSVAIRIPLEQHRILSMLTSGKSYIDAAY
jgi:hypothetical protein